MPGDAVRRPYEALALTPIDCAAFSYQGDDRKSVWRAVRGGFCFVAVLSGEVTVLRLSFFDALWFKFVSLRPESTLLPYV